MFSEIAPSYDLLNHLLSLNIDKRWRARALRSLQWDRQPAGLYLDLCAGTLDVSVELSRRPGFRGFVVGADFAEPMLRAARRKAVGLPVAPVVADALDLPLVSGCCAGAVVAFGVRNLANLDAGLREIARVLDHGARLIILEFSTPRAAIVRTVYHAYFHRVLPLVGRLVSGHPTAYRYLPQSVVNFPAAEELALRMRAAGFVNVSFTTLSFGIAAIHVGERTVLRPARTEEALASAGGEMR
ncbi:MAG: ubiquinone/menaquinone biosynthesis methyltransferase [Gemmatimonadota bacterium]|nr:ubiquinone/menaquinone biosynthesis methyltransferase [Gemmatimonadota bacterium]